MTPSRLRTFWRLLKRAGVKNGYPDSKRTVMEGKGARPFNADENRTSECSEFSAAC